MFLKLHTWGHTITLSNGERNKVTCRIGFSVFPTITSSDGVIKGNL